MTELGRVVITQQIKHGDANMLKGFLLLIYRRQTSFEQDAHVTSESNGIGFNKTDAYILSPLAEKVGQGGVLTPFEVAEVRNRLLKYVGQLERILSNAKF